MKTKKCNICNKIKAIKDFYVCKGCINNISPHCKKCDNVKTAVYRNNNIEKLKESRRENKLKQSNYAKAWYAENKAHVIKYQRKYQKIRRNTDTLFKLKKNLRSRLYSALKGFNKSAKTEELIGCSINDLKNYLTKNFKNDMTWDNYGNKKDIKCWEVDHIKACASFDLSKEFEQRKCFHYTNLQPLWMKDNRVKSKY